MDTYLHPLCSRDFFYTHKDGTITEYHSKHYERCMELFNVDAPIVDETFILVSKGMGIDFVTDDRIEYMSAGLCKRCTTEYDVTLPAVDMLVQAKLIDSDFNATIEELQAYREKLERRVAPRRKLTYIMNKEVKDYEEAFKTAYERFKYHRFNPVTHENNAYSMPRYYTAKMLTDAVRTSLTAYVQALNVEVYREQLAALRAQDPTREDAEIVSLLEAETQKERQYRTDLVRKQFKKQITKSKL